jgi:hypothetical protein
MVKFLKVWDSIPGAFPISPLPSRFFTTLYVYIHCCALPLLLLCHQIAVSLVGLEGG